MIRVLLADDHRLLLEGLAQALQSVPDLEVAGTAEDGHQLLDLADSMSPDVLVVDLDMPGLDGLSALRKLRQPVPAIVVTMHADEDHRRAAADSGAVGFLSKSTPLPELAAAIRAVVSGEDLIESESLEEVLDRYRNPRLDAGAAALTERERELLGLLASGVSRTEELASRMFISQKTVKNHLANIYAKLAVADRAQAAVEAIRLGLKAPTK